MDMAYRPQAFNTRQMMHRNTFEIFHYRDQSLQDVALHHHDFYEIYFFLSGNVSYNIESRNYRLTPGDLLIISPNELHQPVFGAEKQNYERIVLWVHPSFLQQFNLPGQDVGRCFDTSREDHTNLLRPDGATRELLGYLFGVLRKEMDSEEFGSDLYGMSCLTQVLVLINRLAARTVRDTEPRTQTDSVVYRVLGYINEHYHEDLSLDMLANKFFISKYHLSREFNRLVGTSVYRYIIQKRLVMAKQMMGNGIPSATVYQHCGFGDYSNFYRAFKAEYQISPREYVESLRQTDKVAETARFPREQK
jgi:AraC-like DNA-binding protein